MSRFHRSFHFFVATQFLGALNDNLFKQLALFLAANTLLQARDVQGLALGVFALPFVLFSGIAGYLSEAFSKQRIMWLMKAAEVGIMLLGAIAFHLGQLPLLLVTLFLMGTHSAFFGPSKYGAIPELVPTHDLLRANAVVTMTTFLAILLGTGLAGPLLDELGDSLWLVGMVCVAIAMLGVTMAARIRRLPPQHPELPWRWNPFGDLLATSRELQRQGGILRVVLVNSAFFFNAAVIQTAIIGLGAPGYLDIGEGERKLLSYVQATLSIAVGAGSLLAPRLARVLQPGRLSALACVFMAFGQLGFNLIGPFAQRDSGGLLVMHLSALWTGIAGAVMIVPINAYLQARPPEGTRGRTFGLVNFTNWVGVFLAAAYYQVLRLPALDVSPALAQSVSGACMVGVLWWARGQVRELNRLPVA